MWWCHRHCVVNGNRRLIIGGLDDLGVRVRRRRGRFIRTTRNFQGEFGYGVFGFIQVLVRSSTTLFDRLPSSLGHGALGFAFFWGQSPWGEAERAGRLSRP
jgi:hypothetical protein